jgi:hypothetical protein
MMNSGVTHQSRHALSRARFFAEKAKQCRGDERVDFEAFLEASIVFARTAVLRLKPEFKKLKKERDWVAWVTSPIGDPAMVFFKKERDWILHQAPPKIGQILFAGTAGSSEPPYAPEYASEFYFYEDLSTPATDTLDNHLNALEQCLTEAERRLSVIGGTI